MNEQKHKPLAGGIDIAVELIMAATIISVFADRVMQLTRRIEEAQSPKLASDGGVRNSHPGDQGSLKVGPNGIFILDEKNGWEKPEKK